MISTSRRRFIQAGVSGAIMASSTSTLLTSDQQNDAVNSFPITIAGYPYDRVCGLRDGRVKVDRCEVKFEIGRIGEMNTHVFSKPQTRAVSEVGLLPFILALANEGFRAYTLIPVFPLRLFRHKSIFIRTDRGIHQPADLRGKRIAVPGYSSSSLTWIRGILQHEFGVEPGEIEWIVTTRESTGESTGGVSKFENVWPQGIPIRSGAKGKDESQLLVDGDVDGVFHAAEPAAFQQGHPKVARLFSDSRKVEQQYYARTGIFPIMHAVAIRKDIADTQPWITRAIFNAYLQARQIAYDDINRNAWYMSSLPWIAQEAEATRKLMGDNYYRYGVEGNGPTLEAILQYAHEQGFVARKLKIEDLFHPSTLELVDHGR